MRRTKKKIYTSLLLACGSTQQTKMADTHANDANTNVSDKKSKGNKVKKERVWTQTELKCFAAILADDDKKYAFRLETLALKKSANQKVFEDIAKDFENCIKSAEFKEENELERRKSKRKLKDTAIEITPDRLRIKYKFLRNQWRMFTDRVKKGSGKAPIDEPEWFTILNPIFSDSMGTIDVSSCSNDIFSSCDLDSSLDSDKESEATDRPDTPVSTNSDDDMQEGSSNASSSSGTKRKQKPRLETKPCFQKRVKSQAQAIQNMAKSFTTMSEMQEKRSKLFTEAEKERQAEFLQFQREQAELNRQHELKMIEMMMKFSRNNQYPPFPYQAPIQKPQQQSTSNIYPYNDVSILSYPNDQSQVPTTQVTHLTQLDPPSNNWYEHH